MANKKTASTGVIETFDYSKVYPKLPFEDLAAFMAGYPNKKATIAYLYRIHPVINRKLTNPKNKTNIGSYVEPLTEQVILNDWGSGRYKVLFNDTSITSAQTRATSVFTLNDADVPAKYNLDELVLNHPDNRMEVDKLKARGAIKGELEMKQADNEKDLSAASVQNRMLDLIERKMEVPAAVASTPAKDEDASLVKIFLAQNTKLLEMLLTQRAAPAAVSDGLGGLRTAGELVKLADELRGGGPAAAAAPSSGSDIAAIMTAGGFLVQAIVAGVKDVFAARAAAQPAAAPVPAGWNHQPGFMPQPVPQPVAQPMPQPVPQPVGGEMFGVDLNLVRVLQTQVPRALSAFEMDIEGADFADALCKSPAGLADYETLYGVGLVKLIEMLRMVPNLDAQLAGKGKTREQLNAWLESFVTYGNVADDAAGGAE